MSRIARSPLDLARRRPGWPGLGAGLVLGALLTLLVSTYLVPALDRPGRPDAGPLVILSGRDDGTGGQRQALVDQWNALHPEDRARIEEISDASDAQHAEMVARAQSGKNGVDIYNLDVTWTAEFASNDWISPLRDADTDGFLASPLSTCQYQGKLWALPFNTDAGLLYYRDDLVTQPPTTWSQLVDEATTVLAANKAEAGYAGQLDDYEGLTVNALEAIWAAGGDVVNASGDVTIDSPATRTALTQLATGLTNHAPQIVLPDSTRFQEGDTTRAFGAGKIVFMRNWPVADRTLDPGAGAGSDTAPTVHFQIARLPGPSVLGGQNLAVARNSAHPGAAQQLVEFLTSERSQQILFERGGFAATREIVYQDTQVKKLYPYAQLLLSAIASARPRPVTPHYAQFSATFRALVLAALANGGQLPPNVTNRLQRALRGYPN